MALLRVPAARAALQGSSRTGTSGSLAGNQHYSTVGSLLFSSLCCGAPPSSKVTSEVSLELLSAMKVKDSIHKANLPGEESVSTGMVHLTHGMGI